MARLGFGCANLASMGAGAGGRQSVRLVRHAVDRGVRYFDTADAYGDGMSERVLGRALRTRRDEVTIATKVGYQFSERSAFEQTTRVLLRPVMGLARSGVSRVAEKAKGPAYTAQDFSLAHLDRSLDGSLRRLDTDRIDVYQLHEPVGVDPHDIVEWAARAVASGKVVRFGVSVGSLDAAKPWLEHPVVTSVQLPFGVLDPEAGERLIPAVRGAGGLVVARGVLGAGLLGEHLTPEQLRERTDKWALVTELHALAAELGVSTVQLACWFVRSRADVDTFLIGVSSIAHADAAIAAEAAPLPAPDVCAAITSIADRYGRSTSDSRPTDDDADPSTV